VKQQLVGSDETLKGTVERLGVKPHQSQPSRKSQITIPYGLAETCSFMSLTTKALEEEAKTQKSLDLQKF
jgi:hypothetical protein